MSLIKHKSARSAHTVKQLSQAHDEVVKIRSASAALKQVRSVESPEITILKAENAALKKQIEQVKLESKTALEKTKIEVEENVKSFIKQDFSKAYDKLGEAIDKAITKFEEQLASNEALALLVAQTALEKIFHPDDDYRELASRMIKKQMNDLRRETIIKVRVSGHDFDNDEALEDLAFALDLRKSDIKISQKLPAGNCTIDLRLGHMELSVTEQWEELKSLFRDMAVNGAV